MRASRPTDGETNLTSARIGELIGSPFGQAPRVIRFTIGVGGVHRITEFRKQPTVEIEPQPTLVRCTWVCIAARAIPRKILIITQKIIANALTIAAWRGECMLNITRPPRQGGLRPR
jgi:hypothetical protein